MPLRDAGHQAFHSEGFFSFGVYDGERHLFVVVTDRAVRLVRPAGNRASRTRFEAYRDRFFAAASGKFDADQVLENGDVLVDAGDIDGPAIARR